MKKMLLYCLAAICILPGCEKNESPYIFQDDYYWVDGQKTYLEKLPDQYYIIFKSGNKQQITTQLDEEKFHFREIPSSYSSYVGLDAELPEELKNCEHAVIEGTGDLTQVDGLIYDNHMYGNPNYPTSSYGASNLFLVSPKQSNQSAQIAKYAQQFRAYVIHRNDSEYTGTTYTLACTSISAGNNVALANWFAETGEFKHVEPDLNSIRPGI